MELAAHKTSVRCDTNGNGQVRFGKIAGVGLNELREGEDAVKEEGHVLPEDLDPILRWHLEQFPEDVVNVARHHVGLHPRHQPTPGNADLVSDKLPVGQAVENKPQ